ncbi:MAG: DNA repair protein RecN, partial [Pseudomonadota bacterium]
KTLNTLAPYQEHSDLSNSIQLLKQAHILVTEANHELRQVKDNVNLDPEQLSHIETRLDTVYQLARKHHIDPQQLHTQCDMLRLELDALQNDSQQLSELEDELNATYTDYQAAANKLSKLRRSAAKKLQKSVSEHLTALHMPSAELLVELEALDQETPSPMGLENPQFLIRTNAGQAFGSLKQVASGGELSRISLAIEVATLATSTVPTLIFDEVDAGIGGATAEVVGDLLQRLGNSKQVICVTHQAQIAAKASHHYQVSKVNDDKNNRVQAFIECLNEADRVDEISRMIGGLSITKATREHAQEMLAPQHAIAS